MKRFSVSLTRAQKSRAGNRAKQQPQKSRTGNRAKRQERGASQRDAVESLAFAVAKRLRNALSLTATANEHADGYGTIRVTGHPVVESLWLRCTGARPERTLLEEERATASLPSIRGMP